MALSNNLISKFVKITKDMPATKESIVYGTVKIVDGQTLVQIDGSDIFTPMSSVTTAKDGDRVKVEIKDHMAVIAGNMTSPSAMYADLLNTDQKVESVVAEVGAFEILISDKASIGELEAYKATVTELLAGKISVDQLDAELATIDELISKKVSTDIFEAKTAEIDALLADKATIEQLGAAEAAIGQLNANKANISDLDAINAEIKNLDTEKADIDELNAAKADIGNLSADIANIDTLIFGSASGNSIQTSFANAVIAMLGNAQIKSAMIESLSASKITSGDIITNNVRVLSEDGSLIISDDTMQISDANRVRVQIGKDASNDYSINIWDANGKLMFSQGGITEDAIKESIIRNDMVAANANISASKLDIDSLFEEINGSTKTIKATKVYFDDEKQTLDLIFSQMSSEMNDLGGTVESQGTQLSILQGQINSKIWQSDIDGAIDELDGTITTLSDQFSEFTQELDEISILVGQHTTQIANKADGSEVEAVESKVTNLTADLSGFKTTVSNTYVNKTDAEATYGKKSEITQLSDSITSTVEDIGKRVSTVEQTADGFTARIDNVETNADDALFQAGLANTYAQAANTNAETANTRAKDAAKTATNYINFSSNGLVIGDMTASSLGNNVLIDSNSVDIRNGTKTLASYQADAIYLAMNNPNAIIDMCGGLAQFKNINDDSSNDWHRLGIESRDQITMNTGSFMAEAFYDPGDGNWADCILSMQTTNPWLDITGMMSYVALSSQRSRSTGEYSNAMLSLDEKKLHTTVEYDSTHYDDRTYGGYIKIGPRDDDGADPCEISMAVTDDTGVYNEMICLWYNGMNVGNKDIKTNIFGSDIWLSTQYANFYPYFKSGDGINIKNFHTAGRVTSNRYIFFTVPISKPIIGNPTVVASSNKGIKVTQDGSYKYGSSDSTYVSSNISYEAYKIGLGEHYAVVVRVNFSSASSTTLPTANSEVGIEWNGYIDFV